MTHESYVLRAARSSAEEFSPRILEGFQFFADQFSSIIRNAPTEDHPMIVVAMEQLAAGLRTIVPSPRMLLFDEIGSLMVSPEIISVKVRNPRRNDRTEEDGKV